MVMQLYIQSEILHAGTDAPASNEYVIKGSYGRFRRTYDWRGPNITFRGNYAGEVQPGKSVMLDIIG